MEKRTYTLNDDERHELVMASSRVVAVAAILDGMSHREWTNPDEVFQDFGTALNDDGKKVLDIANLMERRWLDARKAENA